MASSSSFLLPISLLLLLSPATLSQTCKSTKFTTPNKSFTSCTDLPHLSATLHWSFSSATSILSIAFTAPSTGWVAWAINPTATAMAGSQALLAHKSSNGSVSVNTYALQGYALPAPGPLSYKVSNLAGEASGDKLTVFGTWQLPAKTVSINQVWQVGPSVTNGIPDKHDFNPDNLKAVGKLSLTSSEAAATPSPAESPSGSTPASGGGGGGAPSPSAGGGGGGGSAPSPSAGKNGAGEVSVGVGLWLGFVIGAFGFLF